MIFGDLYDAEIPSNYQGYRKDNTRHHVNNRIHLIILSQWYSVLPNDNTHVWLCPVGEAGLLAGPVAGHGAADAEERGEGGGQHQHPGDNQEGQDAPTRQDGGVPDTSS